MSKSTRNRLIAILLLSVLLRVGIALYLGDATPTGKDEHSYSTLAARLATGHGYSFATAWYPFTPADAPTSHWSFLYTALVAGVYAVFGSHPIAARLVEAVAGGGVMPWLMFRLTRRLETEDYRLQNISAPHTSVQSSIALLAAFLSAVYAYFVLYGAMVQTETFYICALLWSLERGLALAESLKSDSRPLVPALTLGLSLGIATLLRQSILPWVAVVIVHTLLIGLARRPDGTKGPLTGIFATLMVAGAVMVGCLAPFTVRNYRVYGEVLLLNSNAGYAMYSAQHPVHGTSFQEYAAAPLPAELVDQGLNEAQWDKELMQRGIGFVLAEPGRYLLLSLSRVRDYFEFWPTADSSMLYNVGRVLSIGILLPFMVYGVYSALVGKGRQAFSARHSTFLLLFMAFYSVLHIFTWAMSRYRLPVDAVALPFAALAIAEVAGLRLKGTKPPCRASSGSSARTGT